MTLMFDNELTINNTQWVAKPFKFDTKNSDSSPATPPPPTDEYGLIEGVLDYSTLEDYATISSDGILKFVRGGSTHVACSADSIPNIWDNYNEWSLKFRFTYPTSASGDSGRIIAGFCKAVPGSMFRSVNLTKSGEITLGDWAKAGGKSTFYSYSWGVAGKEYEIEIKQNNVEGWSALYLTDVESGERIKTSEGGTYTGYKNNYNVKPSARTTTSFDNNKMKVCIGNSITNNNATPYSVSYDLNELRIIADGKVVWTPSVKYYNK